MPRITSGTLAIRVLALLAVHPDGLVSSDRLGELLNANPVVVRRLIARPAALAAADAAYLAELDRWTVAQVTEGLV